MRNPHYRSFVKDNLLVLLGQVLIFIKPLLIAPLIIKTISVEVFGAYVLVLSLVSFVTGTAPLGTGFLFRRYAPSAEDLAYRTRCFYQQLYFQIISISLFSCILALLAPAVRTAFFRNAQPFSMWVFAAYCLFHVAYSQVSNYFRYTSRMREFVSATVAFPYLSILFVFGFYLFGYELNVNSLLNMDILALVLVSLIGSVKIVKDIGILFSLPDWAELKRDVSLGFPGILAYWTDFILTSSSRYLIAYFISLAAVGSYSTALQIGMLAVVAPRILGVAMPPVLIRAVDSGDMNSAKVMIVYAIKGFVALAVPFAIMSACFSRPIITVYATKEIADSVYYVVPCVATAVVFCGLSSIISHAHTIALKTKVVFQANLLASATNLVANLVGLYFFRTLLVPAVSIVLGYLVLFYVLRKELPADWGIEFPVGFTLKSGVLALISGVSGYAVYYLLMCLGLKIFTVTIPALVVTVSVYILLAWKSRMLNDNEVSYIRQYFCRRSLQNQPPRVS